MKNLKFFPICDGGIIGGIFGGITGIAQMIGGAVRNAKANKIKPPLEDSEQRSNYIDILRKSRGYETGSAVSRILGNIGIGEATADAGIVSAGGGDGGATLQALIRTNRNTGSAYNEALSVAEQNSKFYQGMATSVLDQIAQRKLELQMYDYATEKAGAQAMFAAGSDNLAGAFSGNSGKSSSVSNGNSGAAYISSKNTTSNGGFIDSGAGGSQVPSNNSISDVNYGGYA